MKPHIYDLDRGEITDLNKFLKKSHSVVLIWCNLTIHILKILKLKGDFLFGHDFLCPCYLMTRFSYFSHSRPFFPFFLNAKSPIFAVGFFEKPPELTKDTKWPTIVRRGYLSTPPFQIIPHFFDSPL